MKKLGIRSCIRRKKTKYRKSTPEVTAENLLNRQFHVTGPNQVWCTDITEFKYGKKKIYFSAIIDLYDRCIIAYVIISDRNDTALTFQTFRRARMAYPDARPIFHSDRGFNYTTKVFRQQLEEAGMRQSMSRVGCCIDNGPCEGVWGIIKSEMYDNADFKERITTRKGLVEAIIEYIHFYNYIRPQERYGMKTPMEVRNEALESGDFKDYPIAENRKISKYWAEIEAKKQRAYAAKAY